MFTFVQFTLKNEMKGQDTLFLNLFQFYSFIAFNDVNSCFKNIKYSATILNISPHKLSVPGMRHLGLHTPQVQIRPWNLSDSDFVMDGSQPLDPRKTIFVGGVPRPLRAGMIKQKAFLTLQHKTYFIKASRDTFSHKHLSSCLRVLESKCLGLNSCALLSINS